MKFKPNDPPRVFHVGEGGAIAISDMGDIVLAPNQQVTFVTEDGARYDFARKDWGYYATPSINGRLKKEGFKTALVRNQQGRIYLMAVEAVRMALFEEYCRVEKQTVLSWLDEHLEDA